MDPPQSFGSNDEFALAVFFNIAFLLKLFDDIGLVIVIKIIKLSKNLITVLKQILSKLIEGAIGRLGLEFLGAVPLGVFKS